MPTALVIALITTTAHSLETESLGALVGNGAPAFTLYNPVLLGHLDMEPIDQGFARYIDTILEGRRRGPGIHLDRSTGRAFAVPVLIWLLVTFRREDIPPILYGAEAEPRVTGPHAKRDAGKASGKVKPFANSNGNLSKSKS